MRVVRKFVVVVISLLLASNATAAGLEVGDLAPNFSLQGSDGKVHKLENYRGKTVVLAWFPKAFTGG